MFKQRHIDSNTLSLYVLATAVGSVGHSREFLGVGHSRETVGLGTPGRLWGWALQGDSGVGHSRETLGLGTPVSGVGQSRRLSGESLGWAIKGESGVGHFREFGHSRKSLGVDRARRRVPGEEKS